MLRLLYCMDLIDRAISGQTDWIESEEQQGMYLLDKIWR